MAPRWTKDHWHEAPTGRWGFAKHASTDSSPSPSPKIWGTKDLPANPDYEAPDGSEIRLLLDTDAGGIAHARIAAGAVSRAVVHQTVDEIWYVLSGLGDLWRLGPAGEETVSINGETCLTIPHGIRFQFRARSSSPLEVLIGTFPRWPGADEAVRCHGIWESEQEP